MGAVADPKHGSKPPVFEAGRIGYAVGDIHGCVELLEDLIQTLETKGRRGKLRPILIFLGDYIDRGPDSRAVIDLLLSERLNAFETYFLRGNHEASMLRFIDGRDPDGEWLVHGGADTLASYGVETPLRRPSRSALVSIRSQLRDSLPPAHLAFLRSLRLWVIKGDYLFVHAGVDPRKPLADQTEADLLWIRDAFLTSKRHFAYCVVHGHTPNRTPVITPSRINLDTGAYSTGVLTAACFRGYFVEIIRTGRNSALGGTNSPEA